MKEYIFLKSTNSNASRVTITIDLTKHLNQNKTSNQPNFTKQCIHIQYYIFLLHTFPCCHLNHAIHDNQKYSMEQNHVPFQYKLTSEYEFIQPFVHVRCVKLKDIYNQFPCPLCIYSSSLKCRYQMVHQNSKFVMTPSQLERLFSKCLNGMMSYS